MLTDKVNREAEKQINTVNKVAILTTAKTIDTTVKTGVKALGEIKDLSEKTKDIIKYIYEKYKGTELKIDDLINSKSPLKEVKVPLQQIDALKNIFNNNKIPFATLNHSGFDGNYNKIVFFEAHTGYVQNILQQHIKEQLYLKENINKNIDLSKTIDSKTINLDKDKDISL